MADVHESWLLLEVEAESVYETCQEVSDKTDREAGGETNTKIWEPQKKCKHQPRTLAPCPLAKILDLSYKLCDFRQMASSLGTSGFLLVQNTGNRKDSMRRAHCEGFIPVASTCGRSHLEMGRNLKGETLTGPETGWETIFQQRCFPAGTMKSERRHSAYSSL